MSVTGCAAEFREKLSFPVGPIQLFVPDMLDVSVFNRGPVGPFQVPVIGAQDLPVEFRSRKHVRLIRLIGELVGQPESGRLTISSNGSQLSVLLNAPTTFPSQTQIDVAGFVGRSGGDFQLEFAQARVFDPAIESQPDTELPQLMTTLAVGGLSEAQARLNFPVDVTGVVTFYDSDWCVMFIADETGGIYVRADDLAENAHWQPGDSIRVTGESDPGGFAPTIRAKSIRPAAPQRFPEPRSVPISRLVSGAEDCQWVSVIGNVLQVTRNDEHAKLTLRHEDVSFEAIIPNVTDKQLPPNLVGSRVSLQGVCGVLASADRQATGIRIHVQTTPQLSIIKGAPTDVFELPLTEIEDILKFSPENSEGDPVRILGMVTYVGDSGLTTVQNGVAGITIPLERRPLPKPGDRVEVVGFPLVTEKSPTLTAPRWKHSVAALAYPAPVELAEADQQYHGVLVDVEATILENHLSEHSPRFTLQRGGLLFSADMSAFQFDSEMAALPVGTVINLEGVYIAQADEWNSSDSFRILVPVDRRPMVVRAAPWWNQRYVVPIVSVLAASVLVFLVWVRTLKTRVTAQNATINRQDSEKGQLSERCDSLFQGASDLIFALSPRRLFLAANPATAEFFDSTLYELLGTHIRDRISPESAISLEASMAELCTKSSQLSSELCVPRGTDTIVLEARLQLQPATGDVLVIARDESDRRELESQLLHLQKMESVGQLAAGVAHDYNNIMTVVLGNSELLLLNEEFSQEDKDNVREIHKAAERASELTNQLLLFSRRQMVTATRVSPNSLLDGLTGMLSRLIGEDILLVSRVDGNLPPIKGDRGMLEQAILNLVLNARDAMPFGGDLLVDAHTVTLSETEALKSAEATAGEFVRISVTDTGTGMSGELRTRIFEPFFTTKEAGRGTGLGLSTVFGISHQHDGWVEVESEEGVGSVFHLYFPVDHSPAEGTSESPAEPPRISRGDEVILVVEDEVAVRRTIVRQLTRAGHHVLEASDGSEGLRVWQENRDAIDLLVTDMVMPGGVSGRELARHARLDKPDLPVIFCSGYSPELTGLSQLGEFDRVLLKPFESSELMLCVRELVEGVPALLS